MTDQLSDPVGQRVNYEQGFDMGAAVADGMLKQQAEEIKRLKKVIQDYDKSGNLEFACLSLEAMLSQQKEEIERLEGALREINCIGKPAALYQIASDCIRALWKICDKCDEALKE